MKVNITTHSHAVNHGAFLQAYALQKYISELGGDVSFRPIEKQKFIQKVRGVITKNPSRLIYNYRKYRVFAKYQHKLSNKKLRNVDFEILGSDVVLQKNFHDITDDDAVKKITYAASCGSRVSDFSGAELDLLSRFQGMSVRDSNTHAMLSDAGIKADLLEMSVDPTFLTDFERETRKIKIPKTNYIVAYGYDYSNYPIRQILLESNFNEKNIFNIGYYNRLFGQNIFVSSPFELPGFIKNCEFLVTTTFHGVMFALKYNRPFIALGNKHIQKKTIWLLQQLSISDRYVADSDEIKLDFRRPLDESNIGRLNELIACSKYYLRRNLCLK